MSRRGRGSITKTSSGNYLIQATVPTDDGKQKRISRRIKGTAKEAEKVLKELLAEADKMEKAMKSPTLEQFFYDTFIPRCESKGLERSTISGYESVFRNHINKRIGELKVVEVSPKHISAMLQELTYGSAVHVKAALSAVFSLAEELEVVELSIMRRKYTLPAKEARARKHDKSILNWEEMEAIAKDCKGESWEPAFLMMAFGGLRREEACAVQVYDVEEMVYDHKRFALIYICKKVQSVGGEVVVSQKTKTKDSERTAVVPPPFSERLFELKNEAIEKGQVWFLEDNQTISNPNTVSKRYDKWFLNQPHKRVPMSNLRHSFTTAMISKGMDSALVSKITGHATMSVTYKNYLRPETDDFMRLF